jgi:broad specificity phosphatase PhoE
VALSPEGLVNTARMGRAFAGIDVSLVLASDLERAWKMGHAIAEASGAPIRQEAALREIDRGEWQGRPKSEFVENWRAEAERYWRDPYRWHVPGGEGDEMVFTRAWPRIAEGLEEVDGGILVVAGHTQLIRVLVGRALNLSVPESYDYCLAPAHATLLVDEEQSWRLAARNVGADEVRPVDVA